MNELIAIHSTTGKQTVSAKQLYDFLALNKTHWKRWYTKNILNNPYAVENTDWVGFATKASGNVIQDFEITLDFAKKTAMATKTAKGEEIRNYFLECEKKVQAMPVEYETYFPHTKREVQVQNSKNINSYNFKQGGKNRAIDYNRRNIEIHTNGFCGPKELKELAVKKGAKKSEIKSGKDAMRFLRPAVACSMSFTDDLCSDGIQLEEAANLAKNHATPIFDFMLKNGITPKELNR